MRLLKGELKWRRCVEFIFVCRQYQAAYELLEGTAPLSHGQQRAMRRSTINTRSCIKKSVTFGTTLSRGMSDRVNRQVLCLQMANRTKNTKLRKAILEYVDGDLISALCECTHNILRGTVRLTSRETVRLRKYKEKLRLIANMRLSISRRRREIQQNDGFLPSLLAPLANITSKLDNTEIDVSEKVRLHNQALLRYNDMTNNSATKPTPVVVVKEKESTTTTNLIGQVVTTLPKALQEKGRQLVSRLKTTK